MQRPINSVRFMSTKMQRFLKINIPPYAGSARLPEELSIAWQALITIVQNIAYETFTLSHFSAQRSLQPILFASVRVWYNSQSMNVGVIPVHKHSQPLSCMIQIFKPAGIIHPALHCFKERFAKRFSLLVLSRLCDTSTLSSWSNAMSVMPLSSGLQCPHAGLWSLFFCLLGFSRTDPCCAVLTQ